MEPLDVEAEVEQWLGATLVGGSRLGLAVWRASML